MLRTFLQFRLKLPSLIDNFLQIRNENKVLALLLPFIGYFEVHFILLVNISLCNVHVVIDDRVVFEDIVVGSISILMGLLGFVFLDNEHSSVLVVGAVFADEEKAVSDSQRAELDVSAELLSILDLLAVGSLGFLLPFPQLFLLLLLSQLLFFLLFLLLGFFEIRGC